VAWPVGFQSGMGLFIRPIVPGRRTTPSSMTRIPPAIEAAHAHQIVSRATEQQLSGELGPADEVRFPSNFVFQG
jgi:hypothetical protein